jgi:hypothetical protein
MLATEHQLFWKEPTKVRRSFLPHSAFWYLAGALEQKSAAEKDVILKHWAQLYGISVLQLRRQLRAAK